MFWCNQKDSSQEDYFIFACCLWTTLPFYLFISIPAQSLTHKSPLNFHKIQTTTTKHWRIHTFKVVELNLCVISVSRELVRELAGRMSENEDEWSENCFRKRNDEEISFFFLSFFNIPWASLYIKSICKSTNFTINMNINRTQKGKVVV